MVTKSESHYLNTDVQCGSILLYPIVFLKKEAKKELEKQFATIQGQLQALPWGLST